MTKKKVPCGKKEKNNYFIFLAFLHLSPAPFLSMSSRIFCFTILTALTVVCTAPLRIFFLFITPTRFWLLMKFSVVHQVSGYILSLKLSRHVARVPRSSNMEIFSTNVLTIVAMLCV